MNYKRWTLTVGIPIANKEGTGALVCLLVLVYSRKCMARVYLTTVGPVQDGPMRSQFIPLQKTSTAKEVVG